MWFAFESSTDLRRVQGPSGNFRQAGLFAAQTRARHGATGFGPVPGAGLGADKDDAVDCPSGDRWVTWMVDTCRPARRICMDAPPAGVLCPSRAPGAARPLYPPGALCPESVPRTRARAGPCHIYEAPELDGARGEAIALSGQALKQRTAQRMAVLRFQYRRISRTWTAE